MIEVWYNAKSNEISLWSAEYGPFAGYIVEMPGLYARHYYACTPVQLGLVYIGEFE
jgi:hypothetical protein